MTESISTSMLKKLTGFIKRRKPGDITPAEANQIQKAAYILANTEVKKHSTPTYLTILSGLDTSEKQVFEATVYYLVKIALNKPKYTQSIIDALTAKVVQSNINPEFREYLKKQIHKVIPKTPNN